MDSRTEGIEERHTLLERRGRCGEPWSLKGIRHIEEEQEQKGQEATERHPSPSHHHGRW